MILRRHPRRSSAPGTPSSRWMAVLIVSMSGLDSSTVLSSILPSSSGRFARTFSQRTPPIRASILRNATGRHCLIRDSHEFLAVLLRVQSKLASLDHFEAATKQIVENHGFGAIHLAGDGTGPVAKAGNRSTGQSNVMHDAGQRRFDLGQAIRQDRTIDAGPDQRGNGGKNSRRSGLSWRGFLGMPE